MMYIIKALYVKNLLHSKSNVNIIKIESTDSSGITT